MFIGLILSFALCAAEFDLNRDWPEKKEFNYRMTKSLGTHEEKPSLHFEPRKLNQIEGLWSWKETGNFRIDARIFMNARIEGELKDSKGVVKGTIRGLMRMEKPKNPKAPLVPKLDIVWMNGEETKAASFEFGLGR